MNENKVYFYDSTLRDGAQTRGVDFNTADKIAIAKELDSLGVDYVEGGWPGANHTDDAFYAEMPKLERARIATFGMTRRGGRSVENDPGYMALLGTPARVVTIVGKTWDFHAEVALGVGLEENIKMISESVSYACNKMDEVLFDAEHFFDGYKNNRDFAIQCVKTAYEAGARWIVLCDTNGGMLPHEIEEIVRDVAEIIPGTSLGIHCHNDTGNANASSIAAVRAGVRQVQGTLNGLGERCGNADLTTIIPNIILKMDYETSISKKDLANLKHVSRFLDERLNRAPCINAPYVGEAAFAHKGGLHVSAVEKDPSSYEHVMPEDVGNIRQVLVSDQAGRSNVIARLREVGIDIDPKDNRISALLKEVKDKEYQGLTYDGAEASFELMARKVLEHVPQYFKLHSFRVIDERRYNAMGELITASEASIRLYIRDNYFIEAAEGEGPVDALAGALRKVLVPVFPEISDLKLVDYKVRIFAAEKGTAAITRVIIESADSTGKRWSTVGVSHDIIDASYNALYDSIVYKLLKENATA